MQLLDKLTNRKQLTQLTQQLKTLQASQRRLEASYRPWPGNDNNGNVQEPLGKITGFNYADSFTTWQRLFNRTIAKRVLSIKTEHALKKPPKIADVKSDGSLDFDTPFATAINRLMQSNIANATRSLEIYDGNFSIVDAVKQAQVLAYGRYGGLYLVFDDDPTTDAREGNRKLLGLQPLDESTMKFTTPVNSIQYPNYRVKIPGNQMFTAHPSRVIHITDTLGFYHTPRLELIEKEVRNIDDMALSLMSSIGISRAKAAVNLSIADAMEWLNGQGMAVEDLIQMLLEKATGIVENDDNVMMGIGNTIPEFIQPKLIETATQFLTTIQSISVKTEIPTRLIMGSEVGSLASTQDSTNFDAAVVRSERPRLDKVFRDTISALIMAGVVPTPSTTDITGGDNFPFAIVWAEDKTEMINNNLAAIAQIGNITELENEVKENLKELSKKLASQLL